MEKDPRRCRALRYNRALATVTGTGRHRMRFLLVNQFYPPDMAPTGQHLHDLARCLVTRGHSVRVLCSRRSYDGGGEYAAEETLDGVEVRRLSAFGFGRRGAARAG